MVSFPPLVLSKYTSWKSSYLSPMTASAQEDKNPTVEISPTVISIWSKTVISIWIFFVNLYCLISHIKIPGILSVYQVCGKRIMPCCLCITCLYFKLCKNSATFWYGSAVHLLNKRARGFCLFTPCCLHKWGNPCNVGTCWDISPWTYFHYINHVQLGLCFSSPI